MQYLWSEIPSIQIPDLNSEFSSLYGLLSAFNVTCGGVPYTEVS